MVINIAHTKGGVGKSTLATNLAVEMQLPIVDLDMQRSSYFFNQIRNDKIDVIVIQTENDLDVLKNSMATPNSISLLTAEEWTTTCIEKPFSTQTLSLRRCLSLKLNFSVWRTLTISLNKVT